MAEFNWMRTFVVILCEANLGSTSVLMSAKFHARLLRLLRTLGIVQD